MRPVAYILRKVQALRICNRTHDWTAVRANLDDPENQEEFANLYPGIVPTKGTQRVALTGWGSDNVSVSMAESHSASDR